MIAPPPQASPVHRLHPLLGCRSDKWLNHETVTPVVLQALLRIILWEATGTKATARPAARARRPQTTMTTCWRPPSLLWRCQPVAKLMQRLLLHLFTWNCCVDLTTLWYARQSATASPYQHQIHKTQLRFEKCRHVKPEVMVSSAGQGQQAAAQKVIHAAQGQVLEVWQVGCQPHVSGG